MGTSNRTTLADGSYIDWSIVRVRPDKWRPHGIRYRIAWIQDDVCRVLFDNHHGKCDHCHIDGSETAYGFTTVEQLWTDFSMLVKLLGGVI